MCMHSLHSSCIKQFSYLQMPQIVMHLLKTLCRQIPLCGNFHSTQTKSSLLLILCLFVCLFFLFIELNIFWGFFFFLSFFF